MKKGDTRRSAKKQPATASLQEIPEADFSQAIQPHRYARLRPGYEYVVFLEPDLWEHFGSAEEVKAALRALIGASKHVKSA